MKLTAKVKLQTTPEQHQALLKTLETANKASNYISHVSWDKQVFNQFSIHHLVYYDVKESFNLTAQLVARCISKVADSYKFGSHVCRIFNLYGSITYDSRILRWCIDRQEVSIWSIQGRLHIPFVCGKYHFALLKHQHGESDLVLVDGQFYLFTTCEKEVPETQDVEEFLGIDLGIKNIAADSMGETFSGGHLNNLRKRHSKLRAKLQSKGTKSAKRLLKKRSKKETRFAKQTNHEISKKIVEKAQRHSMGIALEDLKGIRDRVTVRKGQRRQHSSWSFADLRQKIEYKAKMRGIPVVIVDPRNTSRTCPECGCIDKANRRTQDKFLCVSCNYASNADTNAAVIISRRAAVNQPYISNLKFRDKTSLFSGVV